MIYFTSDLHFGHNKPFLYEPRGFKNIQEHDETIIQQWNSIILPEDEVYILGDLMLNDNEHGIKCINRLMGFKHFVIGNHDTDARLDMYVDNDMDLRGYADIFHYGKYRFYLSHYPTLCANFDDTKALRMQTINLCGHSHTRDKFADIDKGLIYHVELDAHHNKPVSIEEIIKDLERRKEQK